MFMKDVAGYQQSNEAIVVHVIYKLEDCKIFVFKIFHRKTLFRKTRVQKKRKNTLMFQKLIWDRV